MNVFVRDKAVLKVPGKARVAGGVNALRNRPPQQSLSVGGLDDVKRGPTTMAGGEPFYVCAEGGPVAFADSSAHSERDKAMGKEVLSRGRPVVDAPVRTSLMQPLLFR
jgi:hypothetical protein